LRNRFGHRNLALKTLYLTRVVQGISSQVILGASGVPNLEIPGVLGSRKRAADSHTEIQRVKGRRFLYGGASRARTDDLTVAKDESCRCHLIESTDSLRVFHHFQRPFIGPVMGQPLGQPLGQSSELNRLRTRIASQPHAAAPRARSERRYPWLSRCASAASDLEPTLGLPRPAPAR